MHARGADRGLLVGDPGVTAAEIVNALTGSAILAAAVREGWRWYTARTSQSDAAKAAAVAAAIQILTDALAEATADASATNPIT